MAKGLLERGFDAAATGLVCTAALGLVLTTLCLIGYYRLARPPPGRQYDPHETLVPRLFQAPPLARPAPLSRTFPFQFSWTIPRYRYGAEHWLSDGDLVLRTAGVLVVAGAVCALVGLAIALPLCIVGVPSLASYDSIPRSLLAKAPSHGSYSTLADLSLLRLLHAYDASAPLTGPSAHTRMLILLVTSVFLPPLVLFPFLHAEIKNAERHRTAFRESIAGGSGWEMAFLPVESPLWRTKDRRGTEPEKQSGLEGLGEARLREVLELCGLGPEEGVREKRDGGQRRRRPSRLNEEDVRYAGLCEDARRDVAVEGVYSVPDLSTIVKLQKARERTIDALEEAECAYIASFEEPPTPAPTPLPTASTTPKHLIRKSLASKPRTNKSSIIPFGPQGHYALTPAIPSDAPSPPSPSLQDAIGRQWLGASFTEVGLGERGDEWELGDRLRVNSEGRWSRAATTPGALSSFGIDVQNLHSRETEPEPDTETLRDERELPSSEVENSIAFPSAPPRPPTPEPVLRATGFGSLATLEESEDEDDSLTFTRSYAGGSALAPTPSDWTESSTRPSETTWSRGDTSIDTHDYDKDAKELDARAFDQVTLTPTTPTFDRCHRESATPPIDDLPSIPDSDDEHYLSSRSAAMPPAPPSADMHQFSTLASPSMLTWRHKPLAPEPPATPLTPFTALEATPLRLPSRRLFDPALRPAPSASPDFLAEVYTAVRHHRSELKRLNAEIGELQAIAMADVSEGKTARGFVLVGCGVGRITGTRRIEGRTREDVKWDELLQERSQRAFWGGVGAVCLAFAVLAIVPIALAISDAPGVVDEWTFFRPYLTRGTLPSGLVTSTAAAVFLLLLLTLSYVMILHIGARSSSVSNAEAQQITLRGTLVFSTFAVIWLVSFGAVASSSRAVVHSVDVARSLADGLVTSTELVLSVSVLGSLLIPATHLLRPVRMMRVIGALRRAKTPRQRFEALKPATPSESHALGGLLLVATSLVLLSSICPLIAAPLVLLAALTLPVIAHSTTYVALRTYDTTGLGTLTTLKWLRVVLALQPILWALVFLSRRLSAFAGASFGLAFLLFFAVFFIEWLESRRNQLSARTQRALDAFALGCTDGSFTATPSRPASQTSLIPRQSMASVFDLLNGLSPNPLSRPPLPLSSESVHSFDDPALAARLHAHATPKVSLPGPEAKMKETMYPPALIQSRALVILPDDPLAEGEAHELEEYWGIGSVWKGALGLGKLPGLKVIVRRRPRTTVAL